MKEAEEEWPQAPPHPCLSYLKPSPPLVGQSLYLGGELGPDKNIYCIPGHASRVLAIYPNSSNKNNDNNNTIENDNDKCIQIGPEFPGKFKWLRGILACNDIIYGLPCHSDSILRIDARDPTNVSITTIPIPYDKYFQNEDERNREKKMIWKYHGGAISPIDNCIYCIPQSAKRVLKIDPNPNANHDGKEILSFVGPDLPGKYKWYGGLVGQSDGAIYGIPQNSGAVLRIHPVVNSNGNSDSDSNGEVDANVNTNVNVTLHGDFETGKHTWHGGGVSSDGTIVCIPNNANTVLLIKPPCLENNKNNNINANEPELCIIGGSDVIATGKNAGRIDRKYKYLGSASDEKNNVYCFPSGAEHVLRVNTTTMEIDEIGPSLYESKLERLKQNKWQNGFYCSVDKCVYAIPLAAETVLKIDLSGCTERDTCEDLGAVTHNPTESSNSNSGGSDDEPLVTTMGLPLEPFGGLAKWEGGVMIEDGTMYCMPNNFKRVLKIRPATADK